MEERDSRNVFIATSDAVATLSSVWLVDSGCSNDMTGERGLFTSLDESQRVTVRLGDDREMEVLGVGLVAISMKNGELKQLQGV